MAVVATNTALDALNETCGPVRVRAARVLDIWVDCSTGSFVGTFQLQTKKPGESSYLVATDATGTPYEWTDDVNMGGVVLGSEYDAQLKVTAFTSGTASARLETSNRIGR